MAAFLVPADLMGFAVKSTEPKSSGNSGFRPATRAAARALLEEEEAMRDERRAEEEERERQHGRSSRESSVLDHTRTQLGELHSGTVRGLRQRTGKAERFVHLGRTQLLLAPRSQLPALRSALRTRPATQGGFFGSGAGDSYLSTAAAARAIAATTPPPVLYLPPPMQQNTGGWDVVPARPVEEIEGGEEEVEDMQLQELKRHLSADSFENLSDVMPSVQAQPEPEIECRPRRRQRGPRSRSRKRPVPRPSLPPGIRAFEEAVAERGVAIRGAVFGARYWLRMRQGGVSSTPRRAKKERGQKRAKSSAKSTSSFPHFDPDFDDDEDLPSPKPVGDYSCLFRVIPILQCTFRRRKLRRIRDEREREAERSERLYFAVVRAALAESRFGMLRDMVRVRHMKRRRKRKSISEAQAEFEAASPIMSPSPASSPRC
eukprot:Hpha_TRINITY_DN31194_c0_g1::TRINITY_DN31194_c0_g1_i1::g.33052::m.33052